MRMSSRVASAVSASPWAGAVVSAASPPRVDTTSEHRARNGQITRGLPAGRRRYSIHRNGRTIHATGADPFEHQGKVHPVTVEVAHEVAVA